MIHHEEFIQMQKDVIIHSIKYGKREYERPVHAIFQYLKTLQIII